jgi:hypothetical protein
MAFEKWQFEAAEMKRSQYFLSGAINRMLKRKLSMAFEKWQYEAEKLKNERFMISGAIKRMQQRQLSMAWGKWQFEIELWYEQQRRLKLGASIFR